VGDQGLTGIKGDRGRGGTKGDKGAKGFHGHHGTDGVIGPPGPPGPAGPGGDAGLPGPAGNDGRLGTTGPPGLPGIKGHLGIQGHKGNKGAKGEPGENTVAGVGKTFYISGSAKFQESMTSFVIQLDNITQTIKLSQKPNGHKLFPARSCCDLKHDYPHAKSGILYNNADGIDVLLFQVLITLIQMVEVLVMSFKLCVTLKMIHVSLALIPVKWYNYNC
jgi:hypothetical protein